MLVHIYSIGYMAHDPGDAGASSPTSTCSCSACCCSCSRDNFLLRVRGAGSWSGLSSYLLIGFWYHKRIGGAGRQEGVPRQPRRRLRLRARDHGDLREHRARSTSTESLERLHRSRRATSIIPIGIVALLRVRGRDGQERPVPAPRLAAGRDGGPDPGLGADPRRDDGQRRRLPRRPRQPALRPRARRRWSSSPRSASSPRSSRPRSRSPRRDIKRVLAYSTLSPAGLHVRRAGRRRVRRRDLPPHDPRLLQGPAVPRLGLGHPRRPRGAGHEPHGRPVAEDPDHPLDDAHRRDRDRRHPAAGRLLLARTRSWARRSSSSFYWVWAIGLVVAVHDRRSTCSG